MIKFFSRDKEYFEFSNYYRSDMVIDSVNYNCVEIYYQAQKFNSPDTLEYYNLIINCDSPQKSKDMGGQKPNYRGESWYINKNKKELGKVNDAIRKYKYMKMRKDWEEKKVEIMYAGLYAKFSQNKVLSDLLMNTKDKRIIEDSPHDKIWGGKLEGSQNLLGLLLEHLRDN
jgi:predicted NAD-dependent protein-ADP-ribosyltransferase YbiA (DUF1768 family)